MRYSRLCLQLSNRQRRSHRNQSRSVCAFSFQMKSYRSPHRTSIAFTLVEVMIAASISLLVVTSTLSVFLFALKTMYKDSQRLTTDSSLRQFLAHVSKKSFDSTEFYLFQNYASLDTTVNLTTDTVAPVNDAYGSQLATGDCLVLISRIDTSSTSNIHWLRVYYRVTTSTGTQAPVRYYEH